jgi:hypothetical protein
MCLLRLLKIGIVVRIKYQLNRDKWPRRRKEFYPFLRKKRNRVAAEVAELCAMIASGAIFR